MAIQTLGLSPPEKRSNPLENPSVPFSSPDAWTWIGGSRETDAGELINDVTAMKISTVFTCIRVLSESVASLPFRLLRITPQGRVQEVNNPISYLLATAPNPEMTAFSFFETLVHHLNLTGNAYAEIERDGNGNPLGLWPLNPRLTRPVRLPTGDLAYETTEGGPRRVLAAKDTLHVPLTTYDGIVGISPIAQCARALGLAAAAEKFGSRFLGNYAVPQMALITKAKVKPEDKTRMRSDWEGMQSGSNAHRMAVLDQDTDIKILSISPQDAEYLATRVHQRSDIAAIFRVPTHMCGSEQKLSNSNVEQLQLSFILDTLRPLIGRIEAELVKKLLPSLPSQVNPLTIQADLSERQRGDTAAQVSLIAAGRQWGALTANDCLRMLGLPATDDASGNLRMVPVNMISSERLLDPKQTPTEVVMNE